MKSKSKLVLRKGSHFASAIAVTLSMGLALPPVYLPLHVPVYGLEGDVSSVTHNLIIPGYTYTNRVATTSGGRVESFTLNVSPDSTAYPIAVQGSGAVYRGGNIESAVKYAEGLGYNVVGAINSDYFGLSTGVPFGIVIEDGIYKSSPSSYSSILFNGSETTILGDISIPITVTNHRSGEETRLFNFNKTRTDTGGLYLYNDHFSTTTQTNTEGLMVRLIPTYEELHGESEGELRMNSTVTMTVIETIETADAWNIDENHYILTASSGSGYREMLEDFQIGDKVTVNVTTYIQELHDAQWATGGGDVMISEGALTDYTAWEHISEGRAPRTAFGIKEDGTLLFYAADGRQSDYSVGLTQRELADHLLEEGCIAAVNLDGGGSTSFSVSSLSAPNVLTRAELVNSPSDGRLRSCATYLLLVDPQDPNHLSLQTTVENILIGSTLDLGRTMVRDINDTILGIYPSDGSVDPLSNLGVLNSSFDEDGYVVYSYSPLEPGVEQFSLTGDDLEGLQELNVVDTLTSLCIIDSYEAAVTSLQTGSKQTHNLDFQAEINGQLLYANGNAVEWTLLPGLGVAEDGDFGTLTQEGVFTSGKEDAIIQVQVGEMTAKATVTVTDMFEDVPEDHWAYDSIAYLLEKGLISGVSSTEYGMGASIRRGDFVLMLYGAFGSPSVNHDIDFSDVDFLDYYYDAIAWASSQGVVSGMGDGTFGAQSSITREQALTILYRAHQNIGNEIPVTALTTLSKYSDGSSVSTYAMQAVAALTGQNTVTDVSSTFLPQTPLTRESMALYLYNMLEFTPVELDSPTQFALHPNEVYLLPNGSFSLLPLLEPAGSGAEITWSSSDPSAVSVDASGTIKNVFTGTGQPVVTVTGKIGSLSASCIVRCVPEGTTIPETPELNLQLDSPAPEVPDVEDTTPETPEVEDTTPEVPDVEEDDDSTDDDSTDDDSTDDDSTEDDSTEDDSTEDDSTEDDSTEDDSTEDDSTEDDSTEDDSTEDDSTDDDSTEDDSTDDDSTEDDSADDDSTEDDSTEDDSTEDDSTEDDSTEDDSTEDDSTEDDSTEDDSTEDDSTEDDSTEDDSTEDDSTEDDSTEDDSTEDDSSEEESTPSTPESDTSTLLPTTSTGIVVDAPGGLNLRSGAGSNYDPITQIPNSTIVTLHGKTSDGAWYYVGYQYTDPTTSAITNVTGYVMSQFMEEKVIVGTVVNAEVGLNLRSGAGTAFDTIMKLPNGSQVAVLQEFTGWYKVQVNASGTLIIGFVSSDFLDIS